MDALPDEILLKIFIYFPIKTLLAYRLVSKRTRFAIDFVPVRALALWKNKFVNRVWYATEERLFYVFRATRSDSNCFERFTCSLSTVQRCEFMDGLSTVVGNTPDEKATSVLLTICSSAL